MLLIKWSRKAAPGGPFHAPDAPLKEDVFEGQVFGHPAVPDGQVAGVQLKKYDPQERAFRDRDGNIVRLRDVDPYYESMFETPVRRINRAIDNRVFIN